MHFMTYYGAAIGGLLLLSSVGLAIYVMNNGITGSRCDESA